MNQYWKLLKIEPTDDIRAIKKAYAKEVKNCHQEDEPERWQELHSAYEWAIAHAKKGNTASFKTSGTVPNATAIGQAKTQASAKEAKNADEAKNARQANTAGKAETPQSLQINAEKINGTERKVSIEFLGDEPKIEEPEIEEQEAEETEADYSGLFEQIDNDARYKEAVEAWTKKELQRITAATQDMRSVAWCRILESEEFKEYLKEPVFWQTISKYLDGNKQEKSMYDYLAKKFYGILQDESKGLSEETKTEIHNVWLKCRSKKKLHGAQAEFWGVVWKVALVILIRFILREIF